MAEYSLISAALPQSLDGDGGLDSMPEQHGRFLLEEVMKSVQALDEDEIKELLFDNFGFDCCWYNKNVSKWSIQKVEDCTSYIGTLETFIEERVVDEVQAFVNGKFDVKDKGRVPDAWDMDMKAEIPLLFISEKEAVKESQILRWSGFVKVAQGVGNLLTMAAE